MPAAYPLQQLFFLDPEADVVAIRNVAKALIGQGKTIMEVQGRGGQMSQKAFPMPPAQVLFECNAALRHINPFQYGRRRTRTYARLSSF